MTMRDAEPQIPVAPSTEVTQVVEHFFRHEAGKMISTLTRIFGIEHLNRAEDVVQETLARALQTWPYYGIPKNPSAWITQVAKNLALDLIRRDKVFRNKENQIAHLMEQVSTDSADTAAETVENGITDDRLRMMFTCCHPSDSARGPGRARAQNPLRLQSCGNCPGLSYFGSRHGQTVDTSQTKNSRRPHRLRNSGRRRTDPALG